MKNQIKRSIFVNLFIVICMLTSCFSHENVFDRMNMYISDDKQEEVLFNALIDAIQDNDKEALKSLFSVNAINSAENFDVSIDDLFKYFSGTVTDYKNFRGGPNVSESISDGKNEKYFDSTYDIKTDVDEYRIAFYSCITNTDDANEVGIYSFYIIKKSDDLSPDYAYTGDGEERYGINIGFTEATESI